SDFAVIVRDKQQAAAWLHPVFEREQLPLDLRVEQKLTEVPLFQQIYAMLNLQASNWSRDDLVKIAEGAYFVWEYPPTSSFIRWARERGAREGEQIWHEALTRDLALLEQRHQEWGDLEDEEVDVEQLKKQMERQRTKLHQFANWLTELRGKLGF